MTAARYQSSDLGGKVPPKGSWCCPSPQSPVHIAAFSKHAFVSAYTHTHTHTHTHLSLLSDLDGLT